MGKRIGEEMSGLAEFFHMGGYGFYVWTSWAIAVIGMAGLFINAVLKRRKLIKQLASRAKRAAVLDQTNNS